MSAPSASRRRYHLEGKTVLITGAAGGIGKATAQALYDRGVNLVLTDLRQGAVDAVASGLGSGRTLAMAVDVTDRRSLDEVVDAAIARFGGVDVVFANAGIAVDPPATIASVAEEKFEQVIEVDLLGVWRTVRAALPQIIARRGHVLITASIYSFMNGTVNAPYAMSKAGVEQFGRALRTELAGHGATAGVLYPGWVATPLTRSALGGDALVSQLVERGYPGPLRKPIKPERVASATVRGIERRSARIVVPRRWIPFSLLRGLLNPLVDRKLERDAEIRRLVLEVEREAT